MTQPIVVYIVGGKPNPWKVVIFLEELGIPYKLHNVEHGDVKKPAFEAINPNGRVPAIEDPNTGLTIWESGAIIEYLVEQYDTKHTLTYTTAPEKWLVKQWLFFQVSGQGPYYGQAAWFLRFHSEKVESAIVRYLNEIKRVMGVLDKHLRGREWLVGDKATYADLAFYTWNSTILGLLQGEHTLDTEKEFPNYHAWHQRIAARPAVQKIEEMRSKAR